MTHAVSSMAGAGAGASVADVGALVMSCGQATLGQIEGSAAELGRAGALLGDAMAVLRGNFSAAHAASVAAADGDECRRHLDAAMVALQCEDALTQMLASMQRRMLQMADVLRYVVASPGREPTPDAAPPRPAPATPEQLAARLRLAVVMLDSGIPRTGPVMQEKAVVGTVDMF